MENYIIKTVRGHIEVYNKQGAFLFSADTMAETEEVIELLAG